MFGEVENFSDFFFLPDQTGSAEIPSTGIIGKICSSLFKIELTSKWEMTDKNRWNVNVAGLGKETVGPEKE